MGLLLFILFILGIGLIVFLGIKELDNSVHVIDKLQNMKIANLVPDISDSDLLGFLKNKRVMLMEINSNDEHFTYPLNISESYHDFVPYNRHFSRYPYRRYLRPYHVYHYPGRWYRHYGNYYYVAV